MRGVVRGAAVAAVHGRRERVPCRSRWPHPDLAPRREIVAVRKPESALRGSGRADGCQVVAHGHAGGGRSVVDWSVGR